MNRSSSNWEASSIGEPCEKVKLDAGQWIADTQPSRVNAVQDEAVRSDGPLR